MSNQPPGFPGMRGITGVPPVRQGAQQQGMPPEAGETMAEATFAVQSAMAGGMRTAGMTPGPEMQAPQPPNLQDLLVAMMNRLDTTEMTLRNLLRQGQQEQQAYPGFTGFQPAPTPATLHGMSSQPVYQPPQQPMGPGGQAGLRAEHTRSQEPRHIKDVVRFNVERGANIVIVDEIDNWHFAIESQFRLHRVVNDKDKLDYMPEALQGVARSWLVTQYKTGAMDENTTWEEFLEMLKEHFVPVSPDDVKRAQYKVLTTPNVIQEKEIPEFSQKFLQATALVGDISQEQMMFDYLQALKRGKLKMHLQESKTKYGTVQEMIKAACAFNNLSNTAYLLGGMTSGKMHVQGGAQPMDIDLKVMQAQQGQKTGQNQQGQKTPFNPFKKFGITLEEGTRRRNNGLCFSCGKSGHMISECPQKQQGKGSGPPQGGGQPR